MQRSDSMNALEFISTTLAAADSNRFTPEKFIHLLDELFAAAKGDPRIQMVLVFRKEDQVAVLGILAGQSIVDNAVFRQVLLPVVNQL